MLLSLCFSHIKLHIVSIFLDYALRILKTEKGGIDRMKRLLWILSLTIFPFIIITSIAFCDEASHRKAAEDLLTVMHLDTMLKATIDKMLDLEISRNPLLQPYKGTLRKFFEKYMSAESLEQEFTALYFNTFTEKELRKLISFYKTPTGQKALKVTPELTAKGAAIGQKRIQDNVDELKQMISEEAQRIQQLQEKQ